MALRVAIIGARGFGKFHAQWYAKEGCEVVAFVTSRPETIADNEGAIRKVVPNFQGRGYGDLREMLEAEQPDAVSVCSPHHLHADHALESLAYGAHVLCEKPLVWLGKDKLDETLTQSHAVVKAASQKGMVFAINTQYAAAVPYLQQIYREQGLPEIPQSVTLTMEAKRRQRDISGVDLWVDLAPHPLSLLLTLFPNASLDADSANFEEEPNSLTATFHLAHRPSVIAVRIRIARLEGELERSITWDGFKVRFEPYVDEQGVYHTCLRWDGGERIVDDFMRVSIRKFVRAVLGDEMPLCDGTAAVRQMEWLIALVRQYLRGAPTGSYPFE